MKPSRAVPRRRQIPGSPFDVPEPEETVEQYEVHDLVTHDKYGLGTVTGSDGAGTVLVDFNMVKLRITLPCAKLYKL